MQEEVGSGMLSVLVIGKRGFIATSLARTLAERGFAVDVFACARRCGVIRPSHKPTSSPQLMHRNSQNLRAYEELFDAPTYVLHIPLRHSVVASQKEAVSHDCI